MSRSVHPPPTADNLCNKCVKERDGDELRYKQAMAGPPWFTQSPYADVDDEEELSRLWEAAKCDGCGGPFPNLP